MPFPDIFNLETLLAAIQKGDQPDYFFFAMAGVEPDGVCPDAGPCQASGRKGIALGNLRVL